jgi:ribosomal protein S27AE
MRGGKGNQRPERWKQPCPRCGGLINQGGTFTIDPAFLPFIACDKDGVPRASCNECGVQVAALLPLDP